MHIRLMGVGTLKELFWRDAVKEYEKRLGAYVRLERVTVAEWSLPKVPSQAEIDQARQKEGDALLAKVPKGSFLCVLDRQGQTMDSEQFASFLAERQLHGPDYLCILIGGPYGLPRELVSKANLSLSFSKFTFSHQLMPILFLEQLYRSYRILRNEPYHR